MLRAWTPPHLCTWFTRGGVTILWGVPCVYYICCPLETSIRQLYVRSTFYPWWENVFITCFGVMTRNLWWWWYIVCSIDIHELPLPPTYCLSAKCTVTFCFVTRTSWKLVLTLCIFWGIDGEEITLTALHRQRNLSSLRAVPFCQYFWWGKPVSTILMTKRTFIGGLIKIPMHDKWIHLYCLLSPPWHPDPDLPSTLMSSMYITGWDNIILITLIPS